MLGRLLVRTVAVAAATTLVIGATAAGAAVAAPVKIGPHQSFIGLVNGSAGIAHHALIKVACPGPGGPGRTTHPLPNQPLKVTRPSTATGHFGNTGAHGTHINAFFGIPPAGATGGGLASFAYYNVAKPIPTTLTVPCSGSGFITFIPFPRDPGTSRAFVVPVDFVNIAT